MADRDRLRVLTDAQWEVLAPLIAACRPPHKTDHHDLRRTIEAIIWRHDNGAKWRQIPAELGPWRMAAQTFGRWSRLGAWERRLEAAPGGGGRGGGGAGRGWWGRGRGRRGGAAAPRARGPPRGAWERLLGAAQRRGGIEAGMAGLTASEAVPRTLDGT